MKTWEELRKEGGGSVARALAELHRRFSERASLGYASRGWVGLSVSHVLFLAELDSTGTRLTAVSESLGTTKQYIGKLAKEISAKGLVDLVGDPEDGRAVLAVPTQQGHQFLSDACEVKDEIEGWLVGQLGPERGAVFLSLLAEMAANLGRG